MTTGLYWYLHYRRGTGDLSQIIVMDQSDDPWLQDPSSNDPVKPGPAKVPPRSSSVTVPGCSAAPKPTPPKPAKKHGSKPVPPTLSPSTNSGPGTGKPVDKFPAEAMPEVLRDQNPTQS